MTTNNEFKKLYEKAWDLLGAIDGIISKIAKDNSDFVDEAVIDVGTELVRIANDFSDFLYLEIGVADKFWQDAALQDRTERTNKFRNEVNAAPWYW